MAKTTYSTEIKSVLDKILLLHSEIKEGIVFGLPCYKYNGVIFATIYDNEVGIKLSPERVAMLLQLPNIKPFRPFGRNRGNQFIAITHDDISDFVNDENLLLESAYYIIHNA